MGGIISKLVYKKTRNQVMNEDVLAEVFQYLEIKDLFALQTVCHQFHNCVTQVFESKRILLIGNKNSLDIILQSSDSQTKSLPKVYFNSVEPNSKQSSNQLKSLVQKCTELSYLVMDQTLDVQNITVLNQNCLNIHTLGLGPFVLKLNAWNLTQIGHQLKNRYYFEIKYLSLFYDLEEKLQNEKTISLCQYFPTLEGIRILQTLCFDNTLDFIPNSINVLKLKQFESKYSSTELQSFENFLNRSVNLIIELRIDYLMNESLLECMKRKCNLSYLSIVCTQLELESLFEFLDLQTSLRVLSLRFNRSDITEQHFLWKYSFPRVRSFGINECRIDGQSFRALIQCFPQVIKVLISAVELFCNCFESNDSICQKCRTDCLKGLSKLKSLEVLDFSFVNIPIESIEKFAKLRKICFSNQFDDSFQSIVSLVNEIKRFCKKNPKKIFRLKLDLYGMLDEMREDLMEELPKNFIFRHSFENK